jgi:hypothetical protein
MELGAVCDALYELEEQMNEELAVPRPVVPPSDVEREACERLAGMTADGSEVAAAKIKRKATLTFDKSEPTLVPEFIARQNAAEQLKLAAQIDALQKRSEHD